VRIVRFDEEVSIPVDSFGSRFRFGPLASVGSSAQVSVLHLPPEGSARRQDEGAQQLLVVLAGSGWVSGRDGRRRPIEAGYGALFEAGEPHEVASQSGLSAVCVEGEFECHAVAVTQDIVVVDYDPDWPDWFERIRAHVWPAVADVAERIDHVGSTSVPGLSAKPVIDMDIVVSSEASVQPAIDRLAEIGYRWRGDFGVPGRQAFDPPPDGDLPAHHLYAVVEDNRAHIDHWLLRDTLIANGELRDRYGALKRKNQELADGDMDVYVAAKAAFVAELLSQARIERGLPAETYWEPDIEIPTGS